MSLFNILQLNMYLLYSAQYLNLHEYNDENTDNNNNNNNKLSEREKKKNLACNASRAGPSPVDFAFQASIRLW